MKLYLAGPMRGIPQFNFPAFMMAAAKLRADGHEVFNPVEKDAEKFGGEMFTTNGSGDNDQAAADFGFNLRSALAMDLAWICGEADGIALLPGWDRSKGAAAEKATADALGLQVIFL